MSGDSDSSKSQVITKEEGVRALVQGLQIV